MNYYEVIKEETSKLKDFILNSNLPLFIISKTSVEGIIASSIIIKILQRLNKNFSLSFFQTVEENKIKELSLSHNKTVIIIDPSNLDKELLQKIKEKELIILDKTNYSVSEKAYAIAKEINIKNINLSYLTMLSLLNFENNYLLTDAEESGKIKQIKGFKIIGSNTRPIHKTIELSIEPFIIGISGSEENSINLLNELDIKIKTSDYWLSLQDLNNQQIDKLINSLSLNVYSKKDIIDKTLLLTDEERSSPLKDIREFNLFLEACILYKKPSIAIAKCLLSKDYKNRSLEIIREYRQDVIKALSLFYTKEEQNLFTEKDNCIIINFKNLISELVLEKTAELIQNSKIYPQKKRIISLCQTKSGNIKCVICYYNNTPDLNIKTFIKLLPKNINVEQTNNFLVVSTEHSNENKLIELVLEHLESTRIEEVNK